jgi:hypothetical protein
MKVVIVLVAVVMMLVATVAVGMVLMLIVTALPGADPGYIRLPQSKIIMYSFIGILLSCEKIENF